VQVKYIALIKYIKRPTNAGKINILKFITFLVLENTVIIITLSEVQNVTTDTISICQKRIGNCSFRFESWFYV